jgi:hypothetical protein
MRFLKNMFNPPYPRSEKQTVDQLIDELLKIGEAEDYLSEFPGGRFNRRCRHIRAREIGESLDQLGGFPLMDFVYDRVRRKLGAQLADHLDFAWFGVGHWTNTSEK